MTTDLALFAPDTQSAGECRERSVLPLGVAELGSSDFPRWENFVAQHPDALAYHHPIWLQVLERAYPCEPLCLGCKDSAGQLQGILPLCWTRGWLNGPMLWSLPHTPYGGPLATSPEATVALIQAAIELVKARPGSHLQLRPAHRLSIPLVELLERPAMRTYVRQLPDPGAELRFGNRENHRCLLKAVRRATSLGLGVRAAESREDFRSWYQLYLETLQPHGAPPQPYSYFEAIRELMVPRGLAKLLLAQQDIGGRQTIVAGQLLLSFSGTVLAEKNGFCRKRLPARPNEILTWSAMHAARDAGFRHFDYGETDDDDDGLHRFKMKWGTEPRRLYRYYYPRAHDPKRTVESRRSSFAYRLVRGLWQALPLAATEAAGGWIYRRL